MAHNWEQDLYRRYGKCFGVYELTVPVLYVSDPVVIRDVLIKDFHCFVNKRSFTNNTDPVMDNMLDNLMGHNWKRVRSIISPTFTNSKLKLMIPLIKECLQTMDKNLERVAADAATADGSSQLPLLETDIKQLFGAYSMEVIIQVAFGVKVDVMIDEDNPIIRNIRTFFARDLSLRYYILFLPESLVKWLKLEIFDRNVTKFFQDFTLKLIDDYRRQQQQQLKTGVNGNQQKRIYFLQLMLDSMSSTETTTDDKVDVITDEEDEDITDGSVNNQEEYEELFSSSLSSSTKSMNTSNKSISIDELISQSVFLFIAGYETTASTLSIVSYLLAKNPVVQEKLFEEVDDYFIHNSQKDVDYDILRSLKYLDAVIKESIRLYPNSPFIEREANTDYTLSTGIQIKTGQQIHIPIYAIHRDDDNFPRADQFIPDRFLDDNDIQQPHNPYVYLPFGIGPRNCLGKRLVDLISKLSLANAVHKYRFIDTGKPMEFYENLLLMAPKKVMVSVEKREVKKHQ
ncbi:cytochrome P450 3A8-like [Oppia nitens]|uniref:cytochrome P450 3A8-like n=1 Tax=Oppia nitens TaxID=1686743 RepID=UPI0023DBF5F2|nr:cytochrome P450 3A8-like [Oppia nitens]